MSDANNTPPEPTPPPSEPTPPPPPPEEPQLPPPDFSLMDVLTEGADPDRPIHYEPPRRR
jgi:hypothetical protein